MSQSKYQPDDLGKSTVSTHERLSVPVAAVRELDASKGDTVEWHADEDGIHAELIGDE